MNARQTVEQVLRQSGIQLTDEQKEIVCNLADKFAQITDELLKLQPTQKGSKEEGLMRDELVRPEIYATDTDYIIPRLDEIDFSKFANEYSKGDFTPVMDEVDSKLQRRMEYYEQELAKGNLPIEVLEELRIKTSSAIDYGYEIAESIDTLIETNRFLSKDVYVALTNENDALQKILGFYEAMRDIITDDIDNLREPEDDGICDCDYCKKPGITDGVQRLINLLGDLR